MITNAWHTSSRMHEAVCLPCIFGCNAFSNLTIAVPASVNRDRNIRDETAHYLICPILVGIISDACHIDPPPNLHDLVYGNDKNDIAGALICAISYHVYHSLKLGNRSNVMKAIDSNSFCSIRAAAHPIAKAFMNEFGIQSHSEMWQNDTIG